MFAKKYTAEELKGMWDYCNWVGLEGWDRKANFVAGSMLEKTNMLGRDKNLCNMSCKELEGYIGI